MGFTGLISPILITAIEADMAFTKTTVAIAGTEALAGIAALIDRRLSVAPWGITGIACFTAIPGMDGRAVTFGMEATANCTLRTMDTGEGCPTSTVELGDREDAIRCRDGQVCGLSLDNGRY